MRPGGLLACGHGRIPGFAAGQPRAGVDTSMVALTQL